jgi:hypothetical protein
MNVLHKRVSAGVLTFLTVAGTSYTANTLWPNNRGGMRTEIVIGWRLIYRSAGHRNECHNEEGTKDKG